MKVYLCVAGVVLLFGSLAGARGEVGGVKDGKKPGTTRPIGAGLPAGSWEKVTDKAAFSPRDTAEDLVFDGKMWLSNGYYHGNKLSRDLWCSTDGKEWTLVSDATPYGGYSEMVVYKDKMWAVKGSVWNSTDGKKWDKILDKTPFGARGYSEVVVFRDKIWHVGTGDDVWNTTDGAGWTAVTKEAPYGKRNAAAIVVFKDKLWLMGGYVEKPNDPPELGYKQFTTFNDVWCSDDGKTWKRVVERAPWSQRMWFIAKVHAGRMWLIGGYNNATKKNLGEAWYTDDGVTWHEFKAKPSFSARHEPTCYVYDGDLWVVAGNSWPVLNDVWKLKLK